jgi:hypothetical protein
MDLISSYNALDVHPSSRSKSTAPRPPGRARGGRGGQTIGEGQVSSIPRAAALGRAPRRQAPAGG